jgi:tetratricopeptide (TPR) repeat protein
LTAINLLSGSIILVVLGWGAILLVLWNLHRHAGALSKRSFASLALVATALALAGVFVLLRQSLQRLPQHKLLVVFPFIEKTARGNAVTSQGLAFAEQLTSHLRRSRSEEIYPLPAEAIFEIANPDSLHAPEYLFRVARGAGVPVLALGVYGARGENDFEARLRLFDGENKAPILQHTFSPSPEAFAELSRGIIKIFDGENANETFVATKAKSEDYYALWLRFLRHEDVAAEISLLALAQRDTTNAALAELSARMLMRNLRERRAHEKEWNETLKVLVPQLQRAARYDSLNVAPHLLLAQCYLQRKKWSEAEKHLRRAQALDERHSKSFVYFAQLHDSRYARDGFDNELELYQHALRLNPFDLEAVLGAADYYRLNLRKHDALELLARYRRINPNHLAVLRGLGRFYVMDNDMASVLQLYEQIIRLDSQDANAFYNLGIAYYHHQDVERARQFFERAIELNDHADARLYLAHIAEQRGETEKSLAYLRERIRLGAGEDDVFAAEARKQLYKKMLERGKLPKDLMPDSLQRK